MSKFLACIHMFLTIEVCIFRILGRGSRRRRLKWRSGNWGAKGRDPRGCPFVFLHSATENFKYRLLISEAVWAGTPMSKRTRDIPIVLLLLIIAVGFLAGEAIHAITAGQIW